MRVDDQPATNGVVGLANPPLFEVTDIADGEVVLFGVGSSGIASITVDGLVVIGNSGGGEVIALTERGSLAWRTGARGRGPGDYSGSIAVFPMDGGIATWDYVLWQASFYNERGSYAGSLRLPLVDRRKHRFIGMTAGPDVVTRDVEPKGVRGPRVYRLWDERGEPKLVFEQPVTDDPHARLQWHGTAGGVSIGMGGCFPLVQEVALGSTVFVVDPGSGQIVALSNDGVSRTVFQARRAPVITDDVRGDLERWLVRNQVPADTARLVLRRFGEPGSPLPTRWSRVVADAAGRLWLRRATCKTRGAVVHWDVVDTTGVQIGVASTPTDAAILAVRGTRVLAVRTDSVGVEHLLLYRLASHFGGRRP